MSATTWLIIAIVGFSLSGIALAIAIFMFIKMNIPAIIGDLTGKTVAREIKAIRDANTSSGDKIHKSSRVNIERGRLTQKVKSETDNNTATASSQTSKQLNKAENNQSPYVETDRSSKTRTTESLSSNIEEVDIDKRRATAILTQNKVTDVLEVTSSENVPRQSNATEVLNADIGATEVLIEAGDTEVLPINGTAVLSNNNGTQVLSETSAIGKTFGETTVLSEAVEPVESDIKPVAFNITKSIVRIHTDEVI